MTSKKIFHYVYVTKDLFPTDARKYYLGVRSCNCLPDNDPYLGSPSDKDLRAKIKNSPETLKKKILSLHKTRFEALAEEERLHNLLKVDINEEFYNKHRANLGKFNPKEMISCICLDTGDIQYLHKDDDRVTSGQYINRNKLSVSKINIKTGKIKRLPITHQDKDWVVASSVYMKNKTILLNVKTGEKRICDIDILSEEWRGINYNKSTFRHKDTNVSAMISLDDVNRDQYHGVTAGMCVFKHKDSDERIHTYTNDPRVLSGELVAINQKTSTFKHSVTGETKRLSVNDPLVIDKTYVGINRGSPRIIKERYKVTYVDAATGTITIKVPSDDHRVLDKTFIRPYVFRKLSCDPPQQELLPMAV